MMGNYKNIIKYPGSKWKLAPTFLNFIPQHHTYVEPFFGSGALFFTKEPSDIELINDMDSDVINLFTCIREDAEKLVAIVGMIPYSREMYEQQFELLDLKDNYERAASFLIKCWMGHGYRTNGKKVGWKNDVVGREQMYAVYNWYRLPGWIMEIVDRLKQVQIEHRPAIEVIERFNYENVFMYLDPPYLLNTRTAKQYKEEMTDADHEELLNVIKDSKASIMLSGYDNDLYNDLLSDWNTKEFAQVAEHGRKRIEKIWCNYEFTEQLTLNVC